MYTPLKKYFLLPLILFCVVHIPYTLGASVVNIDASSLIPHSEISVTPSSATFIEGSIFEVPILINTKGKSINAIELNIKYDASKLSIVKPSTGKSIISLWVQPPTYDNTKGIATVVGAIPDGIVSDSSLIITITFQAKATGQAEVRIQDTSSVWPWHADNSFIKQRIVYDTAKSSGGIVSIF